jgi:hypothetical protein
MHSLKEELYSLFENSKNLGKDINTNRLDKKTSHTIGIVSQQSNGGLGK